MSDNLLTLATFPSPTEAGFFRSLLESEGIPCYLSDEATVSINPLLGNTIGWVKLLVAERDLDRAIELLESRKIEAAGILPEELAGEALEEPAEDTEPETEGGRSSEREAETEDWLEDPQEELARRAFRASVLGWAFFPLVFYAAWLLGRLIFSRGEWSARTSRNAWSAVAMILVWFASVWLFFAALEGSPRYGREEGVINVRRESQPRYSAGWHALNDVRSEGRDERLGRSHLKGGFEWDAGIDASAASSLTLRVEIVEMNAASSDARRAVLSC